MIIAVKIHCDDHSSLSSITAVQKGIISYISHQEISSRHGANSRASWKILCPVGSETNVSLPQRKLNKDLDCGSVRLEISPISTFVIAHFTAFSKTLYESEAAATFVDRL